MNIMVIKTGRLIEVSEIHMVMFKDDYVMMRRHQFEDDESAPGGRDSSLCSE